MTLSPGPLSCPMCRVALIECADIVTTMETESVLLDAALALLDDCPVDAVPYEKILYLLQSHAEALRDRMAELRRVTEKRF